MNVLCQKNIYYELRQNSASFACLLVRAHILKTAKEHFLKTFIVKHLHYNDKERLNKTKSKKSKICHLKVNNFILAFARN